MHFQACLWKNNVYGCYQEWIKKCGIYPFNPDATDNTKLTLSLIPTWSTQLEYALNQPSSEPSIENSSATPVPAVISILVTSKLVPIELIDVYVKPLIKQLIHALVTQERVITNDYHQQ